MKTLRILLSVVSLVSLCCGVSALWAQISSEPGIPGCSIGVPDVNIGGFGIPDGCSPGVPSVSSGTGPPPPCIPGAATGQMDFSVCSNIGITAATW